MEGNDKESFRVMEEAQAVTLRERTTDHARRLIRLYRRLPKDALARTTDELIAIFVTLLVNAKRKQSSGR